MNYQQFSYYGVPRGLKVGVTGVNVSVRDNFLFCILFGINVYYFPLFYYDVMNVIATTSGNFHLCVSRVMFIQSCLL